MRNFISIQSLLLIILCLYVSAEANTSISPMDKTEQNALYSAIQSLVGKWWNGSDLYPDPCGWTPIQGVSCDLFNDLWYVTVINIGPINDNSLECARNLEISPHLFGLKHLKSLSFFNCFNYPITVPSENWEKLAGSLESLEFRSNPKLLGEFPTGLCSLTKLQSLVLMDNGLTGELPANLGNLAELKRLVLAGNRFSGRIPVSLGGLTELLIIDLSRNFISGVLPMSIGGLVSLLKLDLSNNLLNGKLPEELGKMKNLTLLDLRNNSFSGGLPQSIVEMVSLEEMLLGNNSLMGGNLMKVGWGNLKNLIMLDLSNLGLTGKIPESIAEMRRLRFLAMDNNQLTGKLSPKLADMPSVNALYLNGNNLTGELEFSEEFYGKMGRRFAVWSNPNLCYPVGLLAIGHTPLGVKQCNQQASISSSGLKTELGVGNPNQNANFMALHVFSGSAFGGFWWSVLVKVMVIVFFVTLFL
ncbi:RNI-like superfamily protein [Tasmannia lanceolata]|uniref:RNI-like superfamily protein n=1 Tax=Tasmannia lanceolata TaxID=3420 RepID=UPI0040634F75